MINPEQTSIEKDNELHLNRFKLAPPSASYIAGLIDGDGCIFIRKIEDGYQSGISIAQCRTNILQVIRYHFGGSITSCSNRNNKTVDILDTFWDPEYIHKHNIRNQYNLLIRSNEYQLLIEYIKDSFVVKHDRIMCLYEMNKLVHISNKTDEKENLHLLCSTNAILKDEHLTKINVEYIQGLFDAEGCIYIDKNTHKFHVSISQKNHPRLLLAIQQFLGFGKVYNFDFCINKKNDCLNFLELIKPGVIVKYNQVIAFETFLNTSDPIIKNEMYKICNKEKHKIEHFTDLNQNEIGKEGFQEIMVTKDKKVMVCNEINLKQVYKEKSEKMTGPGNHNFGKEFSEEHKKKMSDAIRDAKGGVTDETILEVRKLINEGKTNIEIQEMLQLSRHNVTRIKCGNIICRTEEKTIKDKTTQEDRNIAKRKIALDEIFIVIDKLIKNEKPNAILDFLNDRRHGYKNFTNLTVDIVKNIKRNISQHPCKLPFYQSEMSVEDYAYYKHAIEEYYIASNKI
jgi:hypothetical protein